jgi:hypothetical protein
VTGREGEPDLAVVDGGVVGARVVAGAALFVGTTTAVGARAGSCASRAGAGCCGVGATGVEDVTG